MKHESGPLFIEITQTVKDSQKYGHPIAINPTVLPQIIEIFQNYQQKIEDRNSKSRNYHILLSDQDKIVKRYLSGVEIKDLCTQLNVKEADVINVLINRDIEIVLNEIPKNIGIKNWRKWRK